MMAGLHPNPASNCPSPIIFGESAKHIESIPNIKSPHDILIAILRPQLSATYGITKNPRNDPMYNNDVRMGRR